MGLTASEVQRFHDQGYLVKPGVFGPAQLTAIKDAIGAVVAREAERLVAAGRLDQSFPEAPMETRLARIYAHCPEAGQAIIRVIQGKAGGGQRGEAMFEMLRHPPLLDCIESLVGPEIVGSSVYRIRPKLPGFPRGAVPWHQDSGYLLRHCDEHLIITSWIPLVDATLANGCLFVLPRAHRQGILRHHTGGPANFLIIDDADLPPDPAPVPVPMAAGGVLFMTNLTPHSSRDNTTDAIRWSLDLRYQGAGVPNNVAEDPASYVPERDPVTMACYPPEADFVLRSRSHAERVVATPAAFEAVRRRYEEAHPHFPGRGWTPWPKAPATKS